jgi:hypothetical protein
MNTQDTTAGQLAAVAAFFEEQLASRERLVYEMTAANDETLEAVAA